jgi:glycosyltransferase involved in cell wall biosynthesis
MAEWHVITCEYPPQVGGVSDYTKLVAHGLAEAGDEVHVWGPRVAGGNEGKGQRAKGEEQRAKSEEKDSASSPITHHSSLVKVHREFGRFRPGDLRRVGKQLDQFAAPRRLLVQWVPHGYGYRSMNLPFCFWLWRRAKLKGDRVELMVHEPFLAFGEGSRKQDLAAVVHRLMIVLLLNAASQIWISTQEWEGLLRPFLLGRKKTFAWLPVPNNIPLVDDAEGIRQTRAKYATNGTRLIGHFGAYSQYMSDTMLDLLPALMNGENDLAILLVGKGSRELGDRLMTVHPELLGRLHATGELPADDISKHISACDVMLQPYQDGVSGRRTSVMTALSHGRPVLTTTGKATEGCWVERRAVNVTIVGDVIALRDSTTRLLADASELNRLRGISKAFYEDCFSLKHIVSTLRQTSS